MRLSNGYNLPNICFGTSIVPNEFFDTNKLKQFLKRLHLFYLYLIGKNKNFRHNMKLIKCVNKSFDYGVTFYDTSRAYHGSEKMLSQALKGVERSRYFICTKLNNKSQLNGKSARETLMESMEQLGVDYVDLYLIHWPVEGKYLDYWKQLEELYKEGLVKAIGVSNCKIHHLEEIKRVAEIMPMVNEVEVHPLLTEKELLHYCCNNNIKIMAYTSTAQLDFRLKTSRRMSSVCEETGKNLAQIILRWHIQNGVIPIFSTSSLKHLASNLNVFDFELTDKQMNVINSMNINARTRYDSDNCEWDRL